MGTSSEMVFNGSGKGYLPAGTIGNRTHILFERLKAGTEFKRLKKGHRPAPMPPTWTHILSYKPKLQCGVCPEKRMAKQERGCSRKVSASLMAITSHLPKGWVSERYSCSDSSACLRLRMRCATPTHSTAPPAIQVNVTPLRPVRGRPEPFLFTMVMGILVEVTFSPS